MTAQDYLTALRVIREIQRKQAFVTGCSATHLSLTLQDIEMYCPLDFSHTGGRLIKNKLIDSYSGKLFNV